MTSTKTTINWRALLIRGGLFALFWWSLTDGDQSSWLVGLPTVALAIIVSCYFLPQSSILLSGIPKFSLFFLIHSLKGGFDVAWRAFHPRLPLIPDVVEYKLQLPHELARVFMVNTVSLLPGTLSAGLEHDVLKVHVLDTTTNFVAELELLEKNVAGLFKTSPLSKEP
jgi:multicomponent Na+:H+ antiporter subunit E